MKDALCFTGYASRDSAYPTCTSTPAKVDAEALAFHPYLEDQGQTPTTKNLPQITEAGTLLEQAQAKSLITTPSYTTITESGVHYGACYASGCDPHDAGRVGTDVAASERRPAGGGE